MRKLDPLPQPEVAVPEHVTGPGGYGRVPRVAGMLTYQPAGGEPLLLAAAHEYLWHQRNAWDHAVEEAQRFFDRVIARGQDAPSLRDVQFGSFLTPSSDLGPDTFEMPEPSPVERRRMSPLATAGDLTRDAGRGRRWQRPRRARARDRRSRRAPPRPRRSARHHRRLPRNRQHARQARRGAAPRAGAAGRRSGVRRAARRSAGVADRGRGSSASGKADALGLPLARRTTAAEARGRGVGGDAERRGAHHAPHGARGRGRRRAAVADSHPRRPAPRADPAAAGRCA